MPKSLTNFNAPVTVLQRFDTICHASGRTRTSVLVELMESFILSQAEVLESRRRQFEQIDEALIEDSKRIQFSEFAGYKRKKRQLLVQGECGDRSRLYAASNREFDPPEFVVSDGQEEW